MNKKFFAALASATMAFTASGSIAVFADDFVEEKTPSLDADDLMPVDKEVVWNKDNFGGLVDEQSNTFTGLETTLTKDEKVKTSELAKVTEIKLGASFKGEVKGLEYFTGLTKFNDEDVTDATKVTTETLDFSANTKLQTLKVTKAPELAEITLPNADEDENYHLVNLNLQNIELTALDLSKQEKLNSLTVKNSKLKSLDLSAIKVKNVYVSINYNLETVTLKNGKKGDNAEYTTLSLYNNALETVNLDYITVTTALNLGGNHIGALDLSKTTAPADDATKLGTQTFYVSEKAKNINLKEEISDFKLSKVAKQANYDAETGVLTLDGKDGSYTYETDVKGEATTTTLKVNLTAANPMNRLYNPNSGEHFYTADIKEKEALVALGWQDEGYGWVAAPTEGATDVQAVYRLYNPNAGDHHYTMIENERDTLVAYGWKDEGTGWYSAATADKVDVYRQYNPYANGAGSHNYTVDKAENDYLVSLGWTPEGTAWYGLK